MRIALMVHPWAGSAAHDIIAENLDEWRAAIAQIPTGRFSAAVYIDSDPKPYPVQRFHGVDWPREVVSNDGFLVVRTGLGAVKLTESQWLCLTQFPDHIRAYDGFLNKNARDITRSAVFPGPKPIEDDTE